MGTTSTANTADAKAKARSEAAKKAAETRKANKEAAKIEAEQLAKAEAEAQQVVNTKPQKISSVICEVLLLVDPDSPNGEGYDYETCLQMVKERIKDTNPNNNTSIDCLRWYATKMRNGNTRVPYRPRSPSAKIKS